MNKTLLFLSFLLINSVAFGQSDAERVKYFQEAQKKFIDTQNPIFAIVQAENGQEETILKTDLERIEQFKKDAKNYYVHNHKTVPLKTVLTKWEERKNVDKNCSSNPDDCIVWQLIEQPFETIETIKTYRQIPHYHLENDWTEKYYQDEIQKAINNAQPIYAKVLNPNGSEEIVLKTDSIRIKELATFPEKYIFEKEEIIDIETSYVIWIKRRSDRCCLSANPDDCLVWVLVEAPIYDVDSIKIFTTKSEKEKNKYLFGTKEHEAYKIEEREKAINNAQSIYAKIIMENGKENVILKTDKAAIKDFEENLEKYILEDVELITFDVEFQYWQKKNEVGKCCLGSNPNDCLTWCLVECPKFTTTETIEIFRLATSNIKTVNNLDINIETDIQTDEIQYKVYPNPFSNQITITSNQTIENIVIFDEVGHYVFDKNINNTIEKIYLTYLSKGVYFVQISTTSSKKSIKIIKH